MAYVLIEVCQVYENALNIPKKIKTKSYPQAPLTKGRHMTTFPVDIPNDVTRIALKVAEFLETLPENRGEFYVSKVTFAFEGDDYNEFFVGPDEFGGYGLKVNRENPK